jgi:hypothetical protein
MDSFLSFILLNENSPYFYSICLLFGFFILEIVALVIGLDVFSFIDDAIPDLDFNIDADIPIHISMVHWFNFGKVPFLILLIIFLTVFGMVGYTAQYFALKYTGSVFPTWIIVIFDLVISFLGVRYVGMALKNIIPTEETSAVSSESFIGKIATITIGTAKKDYPAQAKLQDEHGRTHYIMAAPINESDEFVLGTKLIVIEKLSNCFLVDKF